MARLGACIGPELCFCFVDHKALAIKLVIHYHITPCSSLSEGLSGFGMHKRAFFQKNHRNIPKYCYICREKQ